MMHTSSMARRVRPRRPRIAIFAARPEQQGCCDEGDPSGIAARLNIESNRPPSLLHGNGLEMEMVGVTQRLSYFGDIMDDLAHPVEPAQGLQSGQQNGLQNSPVLVIIAQHALARTCILNILKRELAGFEIVEMATTSGLNW